MIPKALLICLAIMTTTAAVPLSMTALQNDSEPGMSSVDVPIPTGFDSPVTPQLGPRPLLTVLMEFTDERADVPAAFIQNQVFGPRPSLNDYYNETSYGRFWFSDLGHWTWVTAWDDPSTPEDESTRSYWDTTGIAVHGDGGFQQWGLRSLDAVGYDFAPLDINGDGTINFGPEIAYLVLDAKGPGNRGGATRAMPAGLALDGKTVAGLAAGVSEDSPWVTLYAHELGHQTLGLPDYYGITPVNIGDFTLMGFSGYGAWAGPIGPEHLDPYSKLKLGWYTPTAVAGDGFYDIPNAETNPASFILYDSSLGTQEYFMVENRWKGHSYDNSSEFIDPMTPPLPPAGGAADISDEGLLVWHVDETRDWNGIATGGFSKVALERRNWTDGMAAWNSDDPDYYDWWDGSTPLDSKWNGGAESGIGMWCVSPAGETMHAWLDAPGPGILVCPGTMNASAIPGSSGTISVKLVNTGDAADTFAVSVGGLGSDLTFTPISPVTLASKASATVDIHITPVRACTNTPGPRILTITAQSVTDPVVSTTIDGATFEVLPFGEPQASFPVDHLAAYPGTAGAFALEILNGGNVADTFSLTFTAIDFGTAYRADPTAIQPSWVSLSPIDPSAPACGISTVTVTISVPADWIGIENATYDFNITAMSSVTTDNDTATGHLTVRATPTSMMFWVREEIVKLLADVDALPPSGVRDGLYAKVDSSLAKLDQAIDRYLAGDDPPASNLFKTTQNKLGAFLNMIDAQRGKALTVPQADDSADKAQQIIDDIDLILSAI